MSEEPAIEERPPWRCPECGREPAISCAVFGPNGDRTMRCKPCTDNFNDVRWLREQLLAARAKLAGADEIRFGSVIIAKWTESPEWDEVGGYPQFLKVKPAWWSVYCNERNTRLDANETRWWDDFDKAYQAATAAGWLEKVAPPPQSG